MRRSFMTTKLVQSVNETPCRAAEEQLRPSPPVASIHSRATPAPGHQFHHAPHTRFPCERDESESLVHHEVRRDQDPAASSQRSRMQRPRVRAVTTIGEHIQPPCHEERLHPERGRTDLIVIPCGQAIGRRSDRPLREGSSRGPCSRVHPSAMARGEGGRLRRGRRNALPTDSPDHVRKRVSKFLGVDDPAHSQLEFTLVPDLVNSGMPPADRRRLAARAGCCSRVVPQRLEIVPRRGLLSEGLPS